MSPQLLPSASQRCQRSVTSSGRVPLHSPGVADSFASWFGAPEIAGGVVFAGGRGLILIDRGTAAEPRSPSLTTNDTVRSASDRSLRVWRKRTACSAAFQPALVWWPVSVSVSFATLSAPVMPLVVAYASSSPSLAFV